MRNTSHLWQLASTSSKEIIDKALSALHVEPREAQFKFLVNDKWPLLNIFVFDLHHEAYRSASAHYIERLPVVIVDYGRQRTDVSIAGSFIRDQTNTRVAELHNLNGWDSKPPFFADYTSSKRLSYQKPRDTSLLSSPRSMGDEIR